jgi:hypothetical protein
MTTYHKYFIPEDSKIPKYLYKDMFDLADYVLLKKDDLGIECAFLQEIDKKKDTQVVGIIDVPSIPKGSLAVSELYFNKMTNVI